MSEPKVSAFCSTRPIQRGQSGWLSQEMPHHGIRHRKKPVMAAPAQIRRRSRSGSLPRTANTTTTIQCRWWIHATGDSSRSQEKGPNP